MVKHLVFAGGGHAHLTPLLHINEYRAAGNDVTVISPSSYHYYSGMGPGMLSGLYRPKEIRFNIRKMVEDRKGKFIEDTVERIDAANKRLFLKSGNEVQYDTVSFNIGSVVPANGISSDNMFPVKPIINLLKAKERILDSLSKGALQIVVTGGGPAGVEITGNIWRLIKDNNGKAEITILAGTRLLKNFPEKVRMLAIKSFNDRGIQVIEGAHMTSLQNSKILLDNGNEIDYDIGFLAVGVKPPELFAKSGLATGQDGGLLVNRFLQSVDYPEIFGGGDCISLEGHSLARVGVYAVRENPVIYRNLHAALSDKRFMPFVPQKNYLLIFNLGNGRGIFCRKNMIWDGRIAFRIKDYIDRNFMRKFQVSGELEE